MTETAPHVYTAIAGVMADLAQDGISKSRRNQQQGYSFRGIDDVYNALAPVLAKHQLVITPRAMSREVVERQTQKGGVLFYVTVDMEFTLASAQDGSTVVARTFGEAMDSADKATNKAQSAAYKYMAMQQFCIPTEGDNDADAHTHEIAPRRASEPRQSPPKRFEDLPTYPAAEQAQQAGTGRKSAAQSKRDGDDAKIKADINACDLTGLLDWETNFDSYTAHVPLSWADSIRDMIELRREDLLAGPAKGEAEMDEAFRATMAGSGAEPLARRNGASQVTA